MDRVSNCGGDTEENGARVELRVTENLAWKGVFAAWIGARFLLTWANDKGRTQPVKDGGLT